ncbi:MAG: UPF0262 family protein [Alphaproteobacteria bacterium]|jgi:uncharacterized protein (UPF0262 family)|nr:UPF0262 family protein [Alphaproteobacteria bacterium]
MSASSRLIDVRLDEASLAAASAEAEHERRVAVFDLLESNRFVLVGHDAGPYSLCLSLVEGRLSLAVSAGDPPQLLQTHQLSLQPLRRVIKDYFLVCESYHAAIRTAAPAQIEAIDMGRRGLHNEGSELLRERLAAKVELDFDTARRLFTLICALHVRG